MSWNFWQKNNVAKEGAGLPKPKDLPEAVGRYLVVDLKLDPDYVWALKAALRPHEENRDIRDFRIFSPAKADAAGVTVRNYKTLDEHPALILFEGWVNKKTNQLKLTTTSTEKAA
jgi:hypothetical protein